ncbi:tetratricopeptide repeat-containing response regulator [Sulfuriferula thiophila]|uniref:tetratricopeptide repeat-containing response regulator n=1 Tax=Sulfuriferula thiophila TaxID=1781211 RepID=UPI000F605CE6|nr:tetratricopeptide repeat-containing response regulator [Sulfuriferula thiophila]
MIDFSKKRALIIDDSPAMCSSLRTTLSNFGITRCEMSNTANEAVFRIRQREFDIIVCDYCLGDGSDGQQILEQLRKSALIAPTVAFLMVTAERGYEKVVSCAELAPDDYLLKPFTAETMRIRLERVFEKKDVFAPIHALIANGKAEDAIVECDRILNLKSKFAIDLIRLKGELLITLGRHDEARALYEQVVAARAIPWARIGLAKTLSMGGHDEEAIEALELAIAETPQYLEAYDLLAQVHEHKGNADLAQSILEKAVDISPNTLSRQSKIGEMAYRNGDLEKAKKAFGIVVNKGKYSFFRSHNDFVNLSRVLLDDGKHEDALSTIADARKSFDKTPELDLASSVMESLIYQGAARQVESEKALANALEIKKEHGLHLPDAVTIDMAKSCFLNNKADEARALVKDVISNFYDDEMVQKSVRKMLENVGRADESQDLIENSVSAVIKLNNEGVLLAKKGDLAGAIELLVTASKRMPQNVQVALNAAHALIVDSDRNGWNEANMQMAKSLIDQHFAKHQNLEKFKKISTLFKDISLKFGVKIK